MSAEQEAVRQLPSADRVWAPDGHLTRNIQATVSKRKAASGMSQTSTQNRGRESNPLIEICFPEPGLTSVTETQLELN